jgi:hypothetical protein
MNIVTKEDKDLVKIPLASQMYDRETSRVFPPYLQKTHPKPEISGRDMLSKQTGQGSRFTLSLNAAR